MESKKTHLEALLSKEKTYFDFIREELINLIPDGDNKVLEIGCGTGNTSQAVKDKAKAGEVIGVEIVSEAAEIAKHKLDKIICGDIEILDLPYTEYFDYIIVGDVLEHLYDPWKVVKKLKKYLKKKGHIIASIPNIRNHRILRNLFLKGCWDYSESGILDVTHLRFFTRKTIVELFRDNGFDELEIVSKFRINPKKNKKYNLINIFTFCLFEEFLTYQYIVKAQKP